MPMMLNLAIFQACWFACVLGAAYGAPLAGPVVVLIAAGIHLWFAADRVGESLFLAAAALAGTALELIPLQFAYSFSHETGVPWGYPLWMSALWVGFATTFSSSLSWLSGRYALSALLGFFGGPGAYLAGEKLGVIQLSSSKITALFIVAVFWAAIVPALFWIHRTIKTKNAPVGRLRGRTAFGLGLAVLAAVPAKASETSAALPERACVWETCVPLSKVINGQELSLRGLAPFRYWGFKVYAAALYAPRELREIESTLGTVPLRLEIHYYRSFSADDFVASGHSVLKNNPNVRLDQIRGELDHINGLYLAVEPRDSYALNFIPGEGLTLLLNDRILGRVEGDSFAGSYLGIWLSRYSISPSFTKELIGDIASR